MKYTEEFYPVKGDRVLIVEKGVKAKVLNVGKDFLAVKYYWWPFTEYMSVRIENARFLHKCPWYLFWQKL